MAATTATAAVGKSTATPIKFAILSDCGGAFAANYEQDIGGAITAISEFGGAKPNNKNKPSAGWHGGSVGGHPLKLVGIGCANDTADSAIKETKRLMEQLGADIMIGPLSGDESVAVANYAKQHPTKTFVNGTAGAWDTTAAVKAPNFFRFNGDGLQWQAGIGSIATTEEQVEERRDHHGRLQLRLRVRRGLHRRLLRGGRQHHEARVPAAQHDRLLVLRQQLPAPDKVDGYFWAIGGTGTVPSIKAFENLYGTMKASQVIGNLFFFSSGADKTIGPHLSGAYVGGFGTAPGPEGPARHEVQEHPRQVVQQVPAARRQGVRPRRRRVHVQLLRQHLGADEGAEPGQGQHLRRSEGAAGGAQEDEAADRGLWSALPRREQPGAQQQYSYRMDVSAPGALAVVTVQKVKQFVTQSFGGAVTKPPSRTYPPCSHRKLPWTGKGVPVVNGVVKG